MVTIRLVRGHPTPHWQVQAGNRHNDDFYFRTLAAAVSWCINYDWEYCIAGDSVV